jgi:flagellin
MSSILTNTSAMTALQNLAMTQKNLNTVQNQISSGLAVANASDNAAYWSISTTMNSDNSANAAVSNALNLGLSVVSTATSAMNSVETILKQMKADLVTAQTAGTDKTQVQSDIVAQQQSLKSIIASSSFNGVNLLDGSSTASGVNIVTSFSRSGANGDQLSTLSVKLGTIGLADAGTGTNGGTAPAAGAFTGILSKSLGMTAAAGNSGNTTSQTSGTTTTKNGYYAQDSVLGFDLSSATSGDLTTIANGIDAAISGVTTAGATLGQYTTTINNQVTYNSALQSAITSGVGSLVDADMNVASTRLQALQTQQQLGIQALSVANQNSQLILKLFQG